MLKIYHNPMCRKSRAGLKYLQDKGEKFQIIQYLRSPITETELEAILMKMDKDPTEIVRTQEPVFKEQFKGKKFTEKEWIKILVQNPKLIQRPIVVSKYKAVVADPPEKIDELF